MVSRLGQDGMVAGRSAEFEKQIDALVEEQVKLKEEQIDLTKKVKVAQMKAQTPEENKQSSASKTLAPTYSGSLGAKSLKNMTVARGSSDLGSINDKGLTYNQE